MNLVRLLNTLCLAVRPFPLEQCVSATVWAAVIVLAIANAVVSVLSVAHATDNAVALDLQVAATTGILIKGIELFYSSQERACSRYGYLGHPLY